MIFPDGSFVDMYPELALSLTINYMRLEVDPSLIQPPDEISTLADTFDYTLRHQEAKDPTSLTFIQMYLHQHLEGNKGEILHSSQIALLILPEQMLRLSAESETGRELPA